MAERVLPNCTSPTTAAASLVEVAGVEPPVLVDAIRAVSWDEIWESDDPYRALKPLVEQRLGLTASLDGFTTAPRGFCRLSRTVRAGGGPGVRRMA